MAVDFTNANFTDIDLGFVKHYLRIEPDFNDDDIEITLFIDTAKGFVLEHTDMSLEELNETKSANIIYLRMISELYHNRSVTNGTSIDPIYAMLLKNVRKISL
ncbi:head-tail connector protein [Bacillus cereus group sp. TH153LC]|uniref:head-tail connector protein n=1 Tax=Bacillus cereus group sp. TH153LC TaxID=3018059 RepID=UPI0022E26630|nr:head-tail connector protein [Bacillus cereus group sp. TH153LC]MDA1660386.1 head-tail connector protein [Bacillus cereus group sp. TH153LC]